MAPAAQDDGFPGLRHFTANGTATGPVRFISDETPADDDWWGIDAAHATKFELYQVEVRHASVGIRAPGGTTPSSVRYSALGDNVRCTSTSWAGARPRDFSYNTIDVGIYLSRGTAQIGVEGDPTSGNTVSGAASAELHCTGAVTGAVARNNVSPGTRSAFAS